MNPTRRIPWAVLAIVIGGAAILALGILFIRSLVSGGSAAGVTIGAPTSPSAATPASPSPSPTTSGTPSPSPTPTIPDGNFDVPRASSVDAATALDRMANPRTGETWHRPVERPGYVEAFAPYVADGAAWYPDLGNLDRFFSIGERDGYDIVVASVDTDYYGFDSTGVTPTLSLWQGVFEMRDGTPVLISHPQEDSGDCSDVFGDNYQNLPAIPTDPAVFYDTLDYPASIAIGPHATLSLRYWLEWTGDSSCWNSYPGEPLLWERTFGDSDVGATIDSQVSAVAGHEPVDLVRREWPSEVTGLVNGMYDVRTPFDTLIPAFVYDPPLGKFGDIVWDAGHEPTSPTKNSWLSLSPAAGDTCWDSTAYSRETHHVAADWTPAGTSSTGVTVYVPVDGGNDVALRVYTRMSDKSSESGWDMIGPWSSVHRFWSSSGVKTEEVPPYRYATYDAFLADNALLAYQRPDGSWALVVRGEAMYSVYECS